MDDLSETVGTYEAVADEYEDRHRDRSAIAELVERFDEAVDGRRVLDVGCGPGWETETFAKRGYEVLGVDLTLAFLDRAAERVGVGDGSGDGDLPNAALARMDMRDLGVAQGSIDGLWACASFLHVPREDAPATLAEFARVLAPGGVLVLSVKEGEGQMSGDGYEGDERTFTLYRPDELRATVADVGLTTTWTETNDDGWLALQVER
jgi:SAM-dependent methyltransferase